MSFFKRGDHVKVDSSFSGVVTYVDSYGEYIEVEREDDSSTFSVPAEHVTRVTPPVKVGDRVTAENVASLPERSVVVNDTASGVAVKRHSSGWRATDREYDKAIADKTIVGWANPVVIYLPKATR